MAGLDVDTSSYPKPVAVPPTNPLDTVGKITAIQQGQQGLQSGALTIQKQQYDLINSRFSEFAKTLTGLRNDPNLDEDKLRKWAETQVKLGYATPEMAGTFITQLPPTHDLKPEEARQALVNNIDTNITHAMTLKEAIDYHYGQQQTLDTGGSQQPISTSPKFGVRSTGLPIANTLPPTAGGYNQDTGESSFAPPATNAVAAPPVAPVVGATAPPAQTPLPLARPAQAPPSGLPVTSLPTPNQQVAQRFAPNPPPLFSQGAEALTKDQEQALGRATALKPAEQALKLLPGLRSGPTTETFNKAVAALKANGIIPTDTKDDPTAIYQEVNKKLSQYVGGNPNVSRSDASQALAEAGSPSVGHQISPALVKLTRDAIALDRVQVARPNAFTDANGERRKDLQNYGEHRAKFSQSIDERAFGLGDLPADESKALVKKMLNKYDKNPNDPEAKKFLRSVDIAKKQGFAVTPSEE